MSEPLIALAGIKKVFFTGSSFGELCDTPSGNKAIEPPLFNRSRAASKVRLFFVMSSPLSIRLYSGRASAVFNIHEITGIRNKVDLARKEIRRGKAVNTNAGSISPLG